MPLTLEQYAAYLDARAASWPAPPPIERPKAKPHLARLPNLRAITWSVYGTLLQISTGDLLFEHPQKFFMDLALEKTVAEFKMWASMSRKPGQPSEYMGQLYGKALTELRMVPSPLEKFPEIRAEKVWENIVKKLLQKDYQFDAGFFGSINEFTRKIAFFFHASLQGTACYTGAAMALNRIREHGVVQGLITNGQCFTAVQLQRGLSAQEDAPKVGETFVDANRAISCDVGARKPSERLFKHVLAALEQAGIQPTEVLHVGSRIDFDVMPAKKLGMRTALFAGDKESLEATADQLKDPAARPDVLVTELEQIADVLD